MKRRIAYLAVVAVALCVFTVLVVMTVMTGLSRDFKVKNHKWVGDCIVSSDSLVGFAYYEEFMEILEGRDFVDSVTPVIKSYALMTFEHSEYNENVEILGIDAGRHCRVTGFGESLHYHRSDCEKLFEAAYDANLPGAVLGSNIVTPRAELDSFRRRIDSPRFSFVINCFPLTAGGGLAKAGVGLVNTKTFYFSDDSLTWLAKVDGTFAYLPFADAQNLCGMGGNDKRASAIYIKFVDGVHLEQGCKEVDALWRRFVEGKTGAKRADLLNIVTVESWKGYRRESIAAMEKEQVMMMVVFGMVGVITVFIVFVVFYMVVSHKSKDVGILKSVGVSNMNIMKLFSGFAFLVGFLGSSMGLFFGWLFLRKINEIEDWLFAQFDFQLWDRNLYSIGDIPNTIDLGVLAVIMLSAIAACLLGGLLPSWQAARSAPAMTLQVNQL